MKEASTFSVSLKKVKKMKIDFNEAVSLLKEKDKILILTHANPDGDTIGSGFALLRALRQLGKRVKLTYPDDAVEGFKAYLDKVRAMYE